MAFSRDNQSVFISDWDSNIKMIKWQAGAKSGDDFNFTQKPKRLGDYYTHSICLTKDEKYLLVGSDKFVKVFETTTRKVTKELETGDAVLGISLIKNGKTAIVSGYYNNNLFTIDLETMKIEKIAENITNGKVISQIVVI